MDSTEAIIYKVHSIGVTVPLSYYLLLWFNKGDLTVFTKSIDQSLDSTVCRLYRKEIVRCLIHSKSLFWFFLWLKLLNIDVHYQIRLSPCIVENFKSYLFSQGNWETVPELFSFILQSFQIKSTFIICSYLFYEFRLAF